MSDKSRRRKPIDSGDSEKLSEDSYEDNEIVKGSEGVRKISLIEINYDICLYFGAL